MKLLICTVLLVGAFALSATAEESEVEKGTAGPHNTKIEKGKATFADRKRLVEKLFKDYNKKLHPDQPDFKMGISLLGLDISVEHQTLDTDMFVKQTWVDNRLVWNKDDFGGVGVLRIPSEEVWTPDVTLYNAVDQEHRMRCWDSNVLLYPNGLVLWVPPCDVSSYCEFNVTSGGELDGEQTCSLKFGSWTYDGWTMDENLYQNETKMDLTDFSKNPKYEVVSTTGERNSKIYDCSEEPYLSLTFNVTLKAIN